MLPILCVIGLVWFASAAFFVVALSSAARKGIPTAEQEETALREAA
jgi:hypothetical protein